jgi:hypothetical protein
MNKYRDIETDAPDYEPLPFYSSDADLADWLASSSVSTGDGDGEAVAEVLGATFGGPEGTDVDSDTSEPDLGDTASAE